MQSLAELTKLVTEVQECESCSKSLIALVCENLLKKLTSIVVYFDQCLGAFCAKKLKKSKKFAAKFLQKTCFLKFAPEGWSTVFLYKKAGNDFFNQRLECAAPKRWSKYTTKHHSFMFPSDSEIDFH